MRLSTFTVSVVLLSGWFASALAQDRLQGIEISAGRIVGKYRMGATFVGSAGGTLPGAFSVSINYTPNSPGANVTNSIVGGNWMLVVCQNRQFLGTLFGTIPRGSAVWNADGTVANVSADLTILGGTGRYARKRGTGSFSGTLSHKTFPPTIGGRLGLKF